ncbi:MAG: ATP-dependent sacrificial sulfur transferase LarE [Desulfobacterales bacterium]
MVFSGKLKKLEEILSAHTRLLVAFSGGVDSTLLLAVAKKVLGDRVEAVTSVSAVHPHRDGKAAAALAAGLGVVHHRIVTDEMSMPAFLANPKNRCYLCKTHLFQRIWKLAAERGITAVAHGANADDLGDFRPGFQAAQEARVAAPLIEAGLTKEEIRTIARSMALPNWNRPSGACLATRIPYGVRLSEALFERVERAESVLRRAGVDGCRVRVHDSVARIEVAVEHFEKLLSPRVRESLVTAIRDLGFDHVALDLEGYRTGSMNRALKTEN